MRIATPAMSGLDQAILFETFCMVSAADRSTKNPVGRFLDQDGTAPNTVSSPTTTLTENNSRLLPIVFKDSRMTTFLQPQHPAVNENHDNYEETDYYRSAAREQEDSEHGCGGTVIGKSDHCFASYRTNPVGNVSLPDRDFRCKTAGPHRAVLL